MRSLHLWRNTEYSPIFYRKGTLKSKCLKTNRRIKRTTTLLILLHFIPADILCFIKFAKSQVLKSFLQALFRCFPRSKYIPQPHNYKALSFLSDVTSGDSTDYVYGYLGVLHSYGIELRPQLSLYRRNLQGFNLPPTEIIPTAQELFIMLDGLAKYCLKEMNEKRTK